MCLSGKSTDTESLDDSREPFTFGYSNGINHLVILEDFSNWDFRFQLSGSEFNLLSNCSTVDLDFHKVSLSLSEVQLADLRGSQYSNNGTVFLYSLKISLDGFLALVIFLPSFGVLGECFLLSILPVLVESSLDLVRKLLGPNCGQSSHASWGFNITNKSNNFHGWALNDSHWFDDVFLDDLLSFSLFMMSCDVGHASFITNEGCQVNWSFNVILGEWSDSSSVVSCSPFGEKG